MTYRPTRRRRELEAYAKRLGYILTGCIIAQGWELRDDETIETTHDSDGRLVYYRTLNDVEAELRKRERAWKLRQAKKSL